MEALIRQHKVLICAGSGGVGKTTISAALGVLAARLGLRVVVLTIDPSKRLAQALGLTSDISGEVLVPGQHYPGQLYTGVVEPGKAFESFVRESMPEKENIEALLRNPLYKQLSTNLSGSQEFTSLDRLYKAVDSGKYDLVILDTPPAQHAMDFLRAPEKIYALFQRSVTQWFVEKPENQGLFRQVVSRGTRTVLAALEKVTGSDFIGELADFFKNVRSIEGKISERSLQVHRILTAPTTGFILITGFSEPKLKEAQAFYRDLRTGGYDLTSVIVNRSFPEWLEAGELNQKNLGEAAAQVMELYQELQTYFHQRQQVYDKFQASVGSELPVIRVPDLNNEIVGLKGLENMANELVKRSQGGV